MFCFDKNYLFPFSMHWFNVWQLWRTFKSSYTCSQNLPKILWQSYWSPTYTKSWDWAWSHRSWWRWGGHCQCDCTRGCWNQSSGKWISNKVQIFWEGHTNLAHLPLIIYKKWGEVEVAFLKYLNFTCLKEFNDKLVR